MIVNSRSRRSFSQRVLGGGTVSPDEEIGGGRCRWADCRLRY